MRLEGFAKLVSVLFHPIIFLFLIPFLIVYKQTESSLYALKWELFTSIFIWFVIIVVLYEKRRGVFSDDDISKREQRRRFYFITCIMAVAYLIAAVFFRGVFFPLSIIAFAMVIGIIIIMIVNNYLKASIHLAVSCAFVITLGLLYGFSIFLATVWVIPLLSWSRIYLKSHTLREEIVGGIIGSAITLGTFFINKSFF